jgi:hypothetical protein
MESRQRKYSRCNVYQIIRYSLLPCIDDKVSTGLLHDFSYSGFCMTTLQALQEGQEISVKSTLMDNSVTSVVRWCCNTETGNSVYRAGLEFKK